MYYRGLLLICGNSFLFPFRFIKSNLQSLPLHQYITNYLLKLQDDISDLLDSSKHVLVSIIKRPQEGLGLSLIPSGPGSIIPTIIVSSIKPASPAYKTEQLNVGDQVRFVLYNLKLWLSAVERFNYPLSVIRITRNVKR